MLHASARVSDGVTRDAAHGAHPQTGVYGARVLVEAATGDGYWQPISIPDNNKNLL